MMSMGRIRLTKARLMSILQKNSAADPYPTRLQVPAPLIDRKEPVVWSDPAEDAPLSPAQIGEYDENGFLLINDFFSAEEISHLKTEAAMLCSGAFEARPETTVKEPGDEVIRSVFSIHHQSKLFGKLASDRRLVDIAQFILGDDIYVHQSRMNYKPGFDGQDFFWHSDFETWHSEDGMPRMRALTIVVLLTPNSGVNSPAMFMRGSHKAFVPCLGETPEGHYQTSLKQQRYGVPDRDTLAEFSEQGIDMPTGPSGSILIFDSNIIHGSNSNISPYPRANAFFVYNALSNRLQLPYGGTAPRPEFVAARDDCTVVSPQSGGLTKAA